MGARVWATWAALSAVSFVAVWTISTQMWGAWAFTSVAFPTWALAIRLWGAPALGVAALALPLMTFATLLSGRFHITALMGLALCVLLLLAYIGLEYYWAA